MAKKNIKNLNELITCAIELQDIYGANYSISEIIQFLRDEERNKDGINDSDYDNLRDYLVGKLMKSLIKYKIIEDKKPYTLELLAKINLKEAMEKYSEKAGNLRECNTSYLFDSYGGDAFNLLEVAIKETIDKWGIDKDINDFNTHNKKLSISEVKLRWVYKRLIDYYDTRNENGSVMDFLRKQYQTDLLEHFTFKKIYDFAENPYDFDDDNEFRYEDVERVDSFNLTQKQFFLLVWKYFLEEF